MTGHLTPRCVLITQGNRSTPAVCRSYRTLDQASSRRTDWHRAYATQTPEIAVGTGNTRLACNGGSPVAPVPSSFKGCNSWATSSPRQILAASDDAGVVRCVGPVSRTRHHRRIRRTIRDPYSAGLTQTSQTALTAVHPVCSAPRRRSHPAINVTKRSVGRRILSIPAVASRYDPVGSNWVLCGPH